MKTRTAGGIGIVLVGIGLLLGLIFKGPGLGGKGTGVGEPNTPPETANVKVTAQPEDDSTSTSPPVTEENRPGEGEAFVTVVIHGDGYRLVSAANPREGVEVPLGTLIERVKAAPGSPEGIRLRILKDRTAQEGARSDLEAALRKAGIKLEEVQEISGFVD